jgi:hypothetical protein
MKHVFAYFTILGVGLAVTSSAGAGVLAMDMPNPRAISGTFNATLGWSFTANEAIVVDGLGFWDFLSDGLIFPHQVGLWNSDGTVLLASTTIAAGTGSELIREFRFEAITPVQLVAGQEYVLGAFMTPDPLTDPFSGRVEAYSFETGGPNTLRVTFASEITYNRSRFIDSSPFLTGRPAVLEFPSGVDSPTNLGSFGPNLTFSSATVPEPASLAVWSLLGLVWVGAARRKKSPHSGTTRID